MTLTHTDAPMLLPVGYMCKFVKEKDHHLNPERVDQICSVSPCVSDDFMDPMKWIKHWKHNDYWLFDSPTLIREVADAAGVRLDEAATFYYEAHDQQFDEETSEWRPYGIEKLRLNDVQPPIRPALLGYDAVTYEGGTNAGCSPLSCNSMADEVPEVNRNCLFDSFEEAKRSIETGAVYGEPGPYRILAVYAVDTPS